MMLNIENILPSSGVMKQNLNDSKIFKISDKLLGPIKQLNCLIKLNFKKYH